MKILIATNSCSDRKYLQICQMRKKTLVDPQQKFFRLLIEGIARNCSDSVEAISALPVSASTVDKYVFRYETEKTEHTVKYHYLPFLNGKLMRYLTLVLSSYVYTKRWIRENKEEEKWIIMDPLCPMVSIPCRRLAQRKGVRVAAVITDIPSLATGMKERKESFIKQKGMDLFQRISDQDLYSYDAYIPLTESINEKVNIHNKPYRVVEGFADSGDHTIANEHGNYVMYAGGVYEKYGVKTLVDAFAELAPQGVELHIFGDGTYVEELKRVSAVHTNIKYMGCLLPHEVVEKEKRALLLVNPRPCNEEFAKYSFPSKTMEYLLSGTAVVSTKLPGIPNEYFKYMYAFKGASREEIKETLAEILLQPKERILERGRNGHEFVLKEKNNIVMAKKILNWLETMSE